MKTDTLFGKTVNIVGNVSADLVLESLGNIYIKSRNKAQTLDEIISSITSKSGESLANKTTIVDSIIGIEGLKNGDFVYDKSSDILYIQVDDELNELININKSGQQYVKRTGDTMTGSLTIKPPSGQAPLNVTSSILNKNFNSQYLDGLPSSSYAQKAKDEYISGKWTHKNNTYFDAPVYYRANTMHYKDSIHAGSLGTPDFASGFGGYGWRLDAATNTLTIDYIVVRKAMYVYELVVNKISATNGSLWVSNASKVEYVCQLPIIVNANPWSSINPTATNPDKNIRAAVNGAKNNDGFIITSSLGYKDWTGDQMADNTGYGSPKRDFDYKNLKVVICEDESKTTSIFDKYSSNGVALTFSDSNFEDTDVATAYSKFRVFNQYFDDEVEFPIVVNNSVKWYSESSDNEQYNVIKYIKTYHKYFGETYFSNASVFLSSLYLVKFDTDNLPVFMPGDILRCQKFTGNGIKYYDAVVCNKLKDSQFIIQVGEGIMDKTTTITYDDNLQPTTTVDSQGNTTGGVGEVSVNTKFYDTTGHRSNDILGTVQEGDSLVQIGHLWDVTRQNAVYITSSDDGAPYIDTMSNVNRPDYSVIYNTPTFRTIKLYKGGALPYTGDYYIQKKDSGIETVQYVLLYLTGSNGLQHSWTFEIGKIPTKVTIWYKLDGNVYNIDFDQLYTQPYDNVREQILNNTIRLQEEPINDTIQSFSTYEDLLAYIQTQIAYITYDNGTRLNLDNCTIELLRGYPNQYTQLITSYSETSLDTENYGELLSEDGDSFIQESTISNDTIQPTRTTKARFGNLDGIIDSRFPVDKQPHGYGLYGENVYLTGEFILSNGKNVAQFDKDILALFSGIEMNSVSYANLKQDIRNLLNEVPTYGNLESAGIFLSDNKIVIFGDSIQIVTQQNEFGGDMPTALFSNGKIDGKFISAYDIHSAWHSDTTQIKVTQIKVSPENTIPYYIEQPVSIRIDNEETIYYYIDDNDNEVIIPAGQVYDSYKDYGWHLKAMGDGYLAQGNISWNNDGDLTIQGSILLKYQNSDGIYIINSDDVTTMAINGESYDSFKSWVQSDNPKKVYFDKQVSTTSTSINDKTCWYIGTTDAELNGSLLSFTVVLTRGYSDSSGIRPGFTTDFTVQLCNNDQVVTTIECSEGVTVQRNISSSINLIKLYLRGSTFINGTQSPIYNRVYGYTLFSSNNLRSQIGSNFQGMLNKQGNNIGLSWEGNDSIVKGLLRNNKFMGLGIDENSIYLYRYQQSVGVANLVADNDSYNLFNNNSYGTKYRINLLDTLDGNYCEVTSQAGMDNFNTKQFTTIHLYKGCPKTFIINRTDPIIDVDDDFQIGTVINIVKKIDSPVTIKFSNLASDCRFMKSNASGGYVDYQIRNAVLLNYSVLTLIYIGTMTIDNQQLKIFKNISPAYDSNNIYNDD